MADNIKQLGHNDENDRIEERKDQQKLKDITFPKYKLILNRDEESKELSKLNSKQTK